MISSLTWIVAIVLVAPLIAITISAIRSKGLTSADVNQSFFLPYDFFLSLILLVNFWVILLILLGSQSLPEEESFIITMIMCAWGPIFMWWRKKRAWGRL